LRVIAGTLKGRAIEAVVGKNTRPTTDKVKEAVFNLLGMPYFQGGWGLDLYAGTGGLGIEALSRGIENVIFVDYKQQAIQTIKKNINQLSLQAHAEIYRNDAGRALKAIAKRELGFRLIFLDPPYNKQRIKDELSFINQKQLLAIGGQVVVETAAGTQIDEAIGAIELEKHQVYGDTEIRIYRRRL